MQICNCKGNQTSRHSCLHRMRYFFLSLHAGSSAVGLGRARERTSYHALTCRPRAIFNGRACSQATSFSKGRVICFWCLSVGKKRGTWSGLAVGLRKERGRVDRRYFICAFLSRLTGSPRDFRLLL